MGVGILIISHERVGTALLDAALRVFGRAPLAVRAIEMARDSDPEALYGLGLRAYASLDSGSGVLVLSDLFGSTPSNVAQRLAHTHGGRLVTGVNLPMLVRVFNYSGLDLGALTAKAVQGGREGVVAEARP